MNEPEPVDEQSSPEIRGGDRPEDYIHTVAATGHSGIEYVFVTDEDEDDDEADR